MSAAFPTQVSTGVISTLLDDWESRLSRLTHDFGPLGTRTCEDILLELRAGQSQAQDASLHALVSLAIAGDQVAEAVVLYFMLPKATHYTRSCTALRGLSHTDAAAVAVGAMWESIRTYPLRRTSSVCGNIGMNALSIITKSFSTGMQKGAREYATADDALVEAIMRDGGTTGIEPEWGDDTFHDLVTVLSWAADTDVLTSDEVALLARYDLGDMAERDSLADALQINRDSLNRRVYRVRCKLIEAVQAHIRANGAW